MKTRKLQAFDITTGWESTPLGELEFQVTSSGDPICPRCNKVMDYHTGQIDEDYMGNAIDGWWHVCWNCGIDTEAQEGNGGYDHDEC